MAEQKIVGIKFEGTDHGKIYYFDPQKLELKQNDKVIVETAHGLAMAIVAFENRMIDSSELVEPLKRVVRQASSKDLEIEKKIKEKEKFAVSEAKKLSEKFKLDMQIVNAEYAFDESKVIINFTSDGRVDFRDLVKALAGILKTRIELRQVGIRDKAKMLGGIGPCGREVCCKRFLRDFEKVNIKMAKNQGISLNPSNINGLCGRLMCCLSYENDQYVDLINKMPKLGSVVTTKDGKGTVVFNDLLKEIVSVKILQNGDNYVVNDYPLAEINMEKEDNENKQNS